MRPARRLSLFATLAVGACVLAACGGNTAGTTLPSPDTASVTPSPAPTSLPTSSDGTAAGLLFTRSDGSTFVMTDVGVSCQMSEIDGTTEVVRLASTINGGEVDATEPFFYAEVVPGTHGDKQLPLPSGTVAHAPAVTLFGYDPVDQNELSGDQDKAEGTLTVDVASCTPQPRLTIEIDGRLGSVYGSLPAVDVAGKLAGPAH